MNGQHEKAISDFSKAIELIPRFNESSYNRGLAYADEKVQHDKAALSDFNKAIDVNPKFANAYLNRGITFFSKGIRECVE